MKKLFFLGLIALLAAACNNSTAKKSTVNNTEKEEAKKEKASSLKGMITGTWTLASVGGESIPEGEGIEFTFNADGTATGTENDAAKWEAKEADGKKYIVITSSDGIEESEIKSIDDKSMVIIDKNKEIILNKK